MELTAFTVSPSTTPKLLAKTKKPSLGAESLLAIKKEQIKLIHDDDGVSALTQEGLKWYRHAKKSESAIEFFDKNPPQWILQSNGQIKYSFVGQDGAELVRMYKKISATEAAKRKKDFLNKPKLPKLPKLPRLTVKAKTNNK